MGLTKNYEYIDNDGDKIKIEEPDDFTGEAVAWIDIEQADDADGAWVTPGMSAPLALNVLGHDIDDEEQHAVSVSIEDAVVQIAQTTLARDFQLRHAAALLKAVIAFDKRTERLATAEKRRERALELLANAFAKVNKPATEWTGDDVGKLREALGRYDAALAN